MTDDLLMQCLIVVYIVIACVSAFEGNWPRVLYWCSASHGWYSPSSSEEIEATLRNYKARIRSLARTIRYTEGAAGFKQFVGELALEFEEVSG